MLMGKLSEKQIERIAKLANLKLTKKEIDDYSSQLSQVVDYFEALDEVETGNVEPTSQTTGLENNTKKDKIDPQRILNAKDALSGSENVHNDYFVVKQVIDKSKL